MAVSARDLLNEMRWRSKQQNTCFIDGRIGASWALKSLVAFYSRFPRKTDWSCLNGCHRALIVRGQNLQSGRMMRNDGRRLFARNFLWKHEECWKRHLTIFIKCLGKLDTRRQFVRIFVLNVVGIFRQLYSLVVWKVWQDTLDHVVLHSLWNRGSLSKRFTSRSLVVILFSLSWMSFNETTGEFGCGDSLAWTRRAVSCNGAIGAV